MPVEANSGPRESIVIDDPTRPEAGCDPARVAELFHPTRDRYLVKLDPQMDRSRGGILVPDKSRPASRTGRVIRTGGGAVSEDGRTVLPMHAREGQRILFEFNAGYAIPRVPDTDYKIIRDGSIIAVVDDGPPGSVWPAFEEDAEKIIPRVRLVQDWCLLAMDRPQSRRPAPVIPLAIARRMSPAEASLRGRRNGKGTPMALEIPETARKGESERGDHWTGTVVARGPGLMSVVRCMDGDRATEAEPLCAVGDRIGVTNEFPFFSLPGVHGYAIVRDTLCMTGTFR